MIFAAYEKFQIGEVVTTRFWIDGSKPLHEPQPFKILREATKEEWREQSIREGLCPFEPAPPYFYEVHTD